MCGALTNSKALQPSQCYHSRLALAPTPRSSSVIRSLLLDPMAVPAPEELALVYWYQPGTQGLSSMNSSGYQDPASGLSCRSNVSYPMYQSMRAAAPAGMQISAFNFLGCHRGDWRSARTDGRRSRGRPGLFLGPAPTDASRRGRWARPTIKREFRWLPC